MKQRQRLVEKIPNQAAYRDCIQHVALECVLMSVMGKDRWLYGHLYLQPQMCKRLRGNTLQGQRKQPRHLCTYTVCNCRPKTDVRTVITCSSFLFPHI